jgi:hypothetical protein
VRALSNPSQRTFAIASAVFLVGIVAIVWGMERGESAIGWMGIFRYYDLSTGRDALDFFRDLRVPIPPNLAAIEFVDYQLTGDISFATGVLYHAYSVIAYGCVLALAYPSRMRLVLGGGLGLLFLDATKYIHPGNAQIYDVAAPCFCLLFVLLLRIATTVSRPKHAVAALALSGFFLSMFELSRPFVIVLLPVILVAAWVRIRSGRRFLIFVVPVALLSGGWHAHLLIAHGETTGSNHAGFNMWRCWEQQVTGGKPGPTLVPEDDAPLVVDRGPNLNNPQHLVNSKQLQRRISHYIVTHRLASLAFIARRVLAFTAGETNLYWRRPPEKIAHVYSAAVRVTSMIFIVGFAALLGRFTWLLVRRRDLLGALVGNLDNLILFVGFGSIVILSIGETGEEARFVISILPLLATVPPIHRLFAREPLAR